MVRKNDHNLSVDVERKISLLTGFANMAGLLKNGTDKPLQNGLCAKDWQENSVPLLGEAAIISHFSL